MKKFTSRLLKKYKLFIFDWDGTLVDSLGAYKLWDILYVQKFYNVDLPVGYFEKLAKDSKVITLGNDENQYFRFLDKEYGNGETPMAEIWENIYSLAPNIQRNIVYRERAPEMLKLLKIKTDTPITLATNAVMKDLKFFSSSESQTARHLAPLDFFDDIITSDHIQNPKPHPESFQRLIERYKVRPSEVLIFEDSINGIMAGKAANADVLAIFADDTANEYADYVLDNWGEMVVLLKEKTV